MKTCGRFDVYIHVFLTSALVWVVSFTPLPFYPWGRSPGTHWIGGWVGPRTGLDDMERRKILPKPGFEIWLLGSLSRLPSLRGRLWIHIHSLRLMLADLILNSKQICKIINLITFLNKCIFITFTFYSIVMNNPSLTFLSSLEIRIQYQTTSAELPALCDIINHRNYRPQSSRSNREQYVGCHLNSRRPWNGER
jgi:hypothetical protein